eukprot:403350241
MYDQDDDLSRQIEQMKLNRLKNSNQICDQIYTRQYGRLKKQYHQEKQNKEKEQNSQAQANLSYQQQHIAKVVEKVKNDYRLKKEFRSMSYFGFTEILDKAMCLEEERHKRPLRESKEQEQMIQKIKQRLENYKYQQEKDRIYQQYLSNFNSSNTKNWKNQMNSANKSEVRNSVQNLYQSVEVKNIDRKRNNSTAIGTFQTLNDKSIQKLQLPSINQSMDISRNVLNNSSVTTIKNLDKKPTVKFDLNSTILNNNTSSIKLIPTQLVVEESSLNKNNKLKDKIYEQQSPIIKSKTHLKTKSQGQQSKPFMVTLFNKNSHTSSIDKLPTLHHQHNHSISSIQFQPELNSVKNNFNIDNPYQENTLNDSIIHQNSQTSLSRNPSLDMSSILSNVKKLIYSRINPMNKPEPFGVDWNNQKQYIKSKLQKLQKSCVDQHQDTEKSIERISKSLDREEKLRESFDFTLNTLQEYDVSEPQGLDILFEYKVNDDKFQKEESVIVAREFKQRNLDPTRNIIERIELENNSRKRRFKKLNKQ